MEHDIQIYVDNVDGNDNRSGNRNAPVSTADKAFNLLPPSWPGRAEIIFVATGRPYEILTDAVSFGTPVGAIASPLVIRGGYEDLLTITASGSSDGDIVPTTADQPADALIGAVLTRLSGTGSPVGTAISIRGNTSGPALNIQLQQSIGRIVAGDRFTVQRPAVTLRPTQTLNLTSHDGRSPNFTLIGIKIAPAEGSSLNFLNVRAHCETCEFVFERAGATIHTNARIHGGIEMETLSPGLDPQRAGAGVYIHSNAATNLISAARNGIFGGHLTFKDITVRVSQGGVLVPHSLEALRAPIHILTGGSALGQPNPRTGQQAWGTATNKARIRNVTGLTGDGLRVFNGGSLNSPVGPIHLDIFGCGRDGIRLDMCSIASFGPPGGDDGLVSTERPENGGFGLNVRNASRALVGTPPATLRLTGRSGPVGLDDVAPSSAALPQSNAGMSLVRVNSR